MSDAMETFDNYALHAVMRDCWERGVTGVLRGEVRGYTKELFLRDGVVIFANSEDPADKLPQVLMGQGRFTEEQFEAVEPNFRPEISVGRNLVDMGLITQQELIEGARAQVYHTFKGALTAREGRYEVQEAELPDGVVNLPLEFPADFFKAFLEMEDRAWISSQFGEDLGFVAHKVEDRPVHFDQVQVADFAQEIYEMIDGETDGNHLAFETDVEDFTLLKFLYALKAMDYIRVDVEPALDPEDESLLDDDEASVFAEELAEAVSQNEQVEKLGMAGFEETMEIGGAAGGAVEEAFPAMDATVELSRASLGVSEPESIFEDNDEAEEDEDEDEPEEDYDAAIAAFEEEDETEEEEAIEEVEPVSAFDEEDDAGFDDLSSDLLEKELEAMAHPLGAALDDGPADETETSWGEESDEEDPEEEETVAVGADPSYQRRMLFSLLLLVMGGFALAWQRGVVDPVRPLTRLGLNVLGPADSTQAPVDPDADLAMIEDDPSVVDVADVGDVNDAAVDNTTEAAQTEDAASKPEDPGSVAQSAQNQEKGPQNLPEDSQVVAEKKPEQPPPRPEPDATETAAAATPDEPEPVEPNDLTEAPDAAVAEAAPTPGPAERFISPVAGGWDPTTGRPVPGGLSLAVSTRAPGFEVPDLPLSGRALFEPEAGSPWAALLARREPGTPLPAAALTVADDAGGKGAAVKAAVKVASRPQPKPDAGATTAPQRPRTVPNKDRFADLMRASQAALDSRREKYTLRLFLACQASSVEKARAVAGTDPSFYVLPREFRGKNCYSVCWGVFDSRLDALEYRQQLPAGIVESLTKVEVYQVKKLL
ncbi:DUF4388 domain-containing protein [Acanthopleuribacter pedis]